MDLSRSLKRPVWLLALVLPVLAWWGWSVANYRPTRVIESHPAERPLTLKELRDSAEVIAIVTPTGKSNVHWNSADNAEWPGETKGGRSAMIVRDDELKVVKGFTGAVADQVFTVRGVGGTVREVESRFDGQTEWRPGDQYLVFLRQSRTPTKEGFETMWTLVSVSQGALSRSVSSFKNEAGVVVPAATVEAAIATQ